MAKINVRVILKFIGMLLCLEAILMLAPYIVALIYAKATPWPSCCR